jgi:hypothetical protein
MHWTEPVFRSSLTDFFYASVFVTILISLHLHWWVLASSCEMHCVVLACYYFKVTYYFYFVIMEHKSDSNSYDSEEDISVDKYSSKPSMSEIEITDSDSESSMGIQQA